MPDDEDDEPDYAGFSEAGDVPDFASRLERIRAMRDEELLNAYRVLSHARVVVDGVWLPMLEAEMQLRGLMTSH